MENKNIPVLNNAFAKIYKTDIINGEMLIILEELKEDSHIEDLYYELNEYLEEQGLSIQYLDYLDTDEIEISDELQSFMDDIDDINRAYRYLGIEASDIKTENLGYSKKGKLKAFDIDDKQRR
jgi:ribosome assembly protein YihI (activator of Der GTPase)